MDSTVIASCYTSWFESPGVSRRLAHCQKKYNPCRICVDYAAAVGSKGEAR